MDLPYRLAAAQLTGSMNDMAGVDTDPSKLVKGTTIPAGALAGLDDSHGDLLAGVGVDYPIGRSALRFNVDTLSFDTVRATVGIAFGF